MIRAHKQEEEHILQNFEPEAIMKRRIFTPDCFVILYKCVNSLVGIMKPGFLQK